MSKANEMAEMRARYLSITMMKRQDKESFLRRIDETTLHVFTNVVTGLESGHLHGSVEFFEHTPDIQELLDILSAKMPSVKFDVDTCMELTRYKINIKWRWVG